MVGLITAPLGEAGSSDMDLDALPSSVTERIDPLQTLKQIGSSIGNAAARLGTVDDYGNVTTPPEPAIDPDALNQKWGIKSDTPGDSLTFSSALPESVAMDMNASKREELMRKNAQQRSPGGAGAWLADMGYGMLDPAGIAASVMPVFGEARIASLLGKAGIDFGEGLGGRIATRAVTGAADASVGNAALVGLKLGLSSQDQTDYTMSDAARDLAYGAALGGVLHPLIGGIGDALGRRVAEIPAARALDDDVQTNGAAMAAATASVMDERPVEVAPLAEVAAARAGVDEPAFVGVPDEPERLSSFLVRRGGLTDVGGDVRSTLGGARFRPGLVSFEGGAGLDDAALAAWEHGYFPDHGENRPSANDLLDSLAEDLNRKPVYSAYDEDAVEKYHDALASNAEVDRLSDIHGINPAGMSRAEFYDAVAAKGDPAAEIEAQAEAHNSAFHEAETALAGHFARDWDADSFYGPPRSLEELEAEYEQANAADATSQGGADRGDARDSDGDPGIGEEGGGSRGRGFGAAGRDASADSGTDGAASRDPASRIKRARDELAQSDTARRATGKLSEDEAAVQEQVAKAAKMAPEAVDALPPELIESAARANADIEFARQNGLLSAEDEADLQAAALAEQQSQNRISALLRAGACVARGFI